MKAAFLILFSCLFSFFQTCRAQDATEITKPFSIQLLFGAYGGYKSIPTGLKTSKGENVEFATGGGLFGVGLGYKVTERIEFSGAYQFIFGGSQDKTYYVRGSMRTYQLSGLYKLYSGKKGNGMSLGIGANYMTNFKFDNNGSHQPNGTHEIFKYGNSFSPAFIFAFQWKSGLFLDMPFYFNQFTLSKASIDGSNVPIGGLSQQNKDNFSKINAAGVGLRLGCNIRPGNLNLTNPFKDKDADHHVDHRENSSAMNLAVLTGVWIPTGGISKLGTHPEVGLQYGGRGKKLSCDLTFLMRFRKTPGYYFATRRDSLEQTDKFIGGYMGIDFGRDLFYLLGHEFRALAGVGFDGFGVLRERFGQKTVQAKTYNFNFGLGYRYFYNSGNYLGFNIKYNLVDYTLTKAIDFTGNPITFHLIFGFNY